MFSYVSLLFLLTGPNGQRCCLCKPEGAVVTEIFDRVYLVVDSCVLFMYVEFPSSFDHSVMHWLNSGLNQKFWLATTVSKCMQTPPPS